MYRQKIKYKIKEIFSIRLVVEWLTLPLSNIYIFKGGGSNPLQTTSGVGLCFSLYYLKEILNIIKKN